MTDDRSDAPRRRLPRRTVLRLTGGFGLSLPFVTVGCGDDGASGDGGSTAGSDGGTPAGSGSGSDGGSGSGVDGGSSGGSDGADDTTTGGPTMDPLPVPPLLEGELEGDVRVFDLMLQTGSVEWIAGNPTATYGVNGDFLGPTLHFRRGESVRLRVTNTLGETTTLHWHGMELPAHSDGGPYQPIAPGETWVSEYDVVQRPLMAWYHAHQMGETARHVHMGLAGLIYLDDPDQSIELPSTYGVDDIPLVVQDRSFAADGTHAYSADNALSMFQRMAGVKGDTMLVNGLISPQYTIGQGLVRFRILNAANARNFNFGFSDDRSFRHIGNEGGLFEAPIETNRVLLGPAERAEILVDFSADATGSQVVLRSYSAEVFGTLFTGMMGANLADNLDEGTFDVMTFEVGQPLDSNVTVPATFDAIEPMLESDVVRTRSIALSMAMGAVFINGTQMLDMNSVPAAINFDIPAGDTELWEITNSSGMAHPLHIHHRHFQVLDIDGAPPPPRLAGWKDTILVEPGQLVRVLLRFEGTPDAAFPYMFHCHILEHEDGGMMGQFYIVEP
jgi:bilirubin oxidase